MLVLFPSGNIYTLFSWKENESHAFAGMNTDNIRTKVPGYVSASVVFYHGLQGALLAGLLSFLILSWSNILSWGRADSCTSSSDKGFRVWKWFSTVLWDCVWTSFLDRKWTTCRAHMENPWWSASREGRLLGWSFRLRRQTVISRMSAFSILDSGCWLRSCGPRRALSSSMQLLMRSLRIFSTAGFLCCKDEKDIINIFVR